MLGPAVAPPEIDKHTWQRLIASETPICGLGAPA
jgi:hypothetical protein